MFDLSNVKKSDIDVVNKWLREYRTNCKDARIATDEKVFEYICNDCERIISLMRKKGVTCWQSV